MLSGPLIRLGCRLLPLIVAMALAACASPAGSARPSAPVEKAEPLPPGIKPLTLEQEEAVAAATD